MRASRRLLACAVACAAVAPAVGWGQQQPQQRRWDWAVLPVASYAPETSLAVGAGGVLFDDTPQGTAAGPRRDDEVALVLIATLRKQFVANLEGIKYWQGGRLFLVAEGAAMRFPNKFWGVGNETPDSAEALYTRSSWYLRPAFGVRLFEEVYAGVGVNGMTYGLDDYAPGSSVADYVAAHERSGWVLGAGPFIKRETRDDVMFPRAGSITYFAATYSSNTGHRYDQYQLDQRSFLSLGRRVVLGGQAFGRYTRGDVPLDELSALGGAQRLRGYFEGRYRDQVYLVAQLEARIHVVWRLSVAPFAAAGNVFPDFASVTLRHPKAAAGLSTRINLKAERELNLRVDVAKSPTSSGLYVNLGEAF